MNYFLLLLFFWANQVIAAYANDSLGPHNDSLEIWIQNKPSLAAQYDLVEHYWRQGRYQDALNLIQSIRTTFELNQRELENHQLYQQLKNLLVLAYDKGQTEANLGRQEVNSLRVIAETKAGFAAVQAANILEFFYSKAYPYYPTLPSMEGSNARTYQQPTTVEPKIPLLKVPTIWGYPNPAINWADIQYDLPDGMKTGTLMITSTNGQQIQTIKINQQKGIINLNTTNWSTGIYFAVLFSNETKSNVYKLVIKK